MIPKSAKISVLVAARKNSKFLAKFLFGFLARTADRDNVEILVMRNEHDDWNSELFQYFERNENIRFFREDKRMGRAGLHHYFNELAAQASGDWLIYFCEDHFIILDHWDQYLTSQITELNLDPKKVYCLIPKFDNVGAMNQIISRGYYEAMGNIMGRHGWIDSYINDVNARIDPDRVIRLEAEMFHDFTHDIPHMLDDSHTKTNILPEVEQWPMYHTAEVRNLVEEDAEKIKNAITEGK